MLTVSAVIPSYLRHIEVQSAVRSVLAQTRRPEEIIVVNDGPDPVKREIFGGAEFAAAVRYVEAPGRRSAAATRNYGIAHCSKDYVALLDDDDVWLPEKIATQIKVVEETPGRLPIVGCQERVWYFDKVISIRPGTAPPDASAATLLFEYGGFNTSALIAPRDLFLRVPFNEELERHEDWEWLLQAAQLAPIVAVPKVLCERALRHRAGLSRPGGHDFTRIWYWRNRRYIDPRARIEFVASILARKAGHERSTAALKFILVEILQQGGLSWRTSRAIAVSLTRYAAAATISPQIKTLLKQLWSRHLGLDRR